MEVNDFVFDLGGLLSLGVTIVMIYISALKFKVHEDFFDKLKKIHGLRILPTTILLLIGGIALWLAVRTIGFFVIKQYIFKVNYSIKPSDIFTMIAYVLTANLCFTLLEALTLESDSKNEMIKGLIEVSLQATIIGFLTILPRYSDLTLLAAIGDSSNYVLIVITMLVSIVGLIFVRQRLIKEPSHT